MQSVLDVLLTLVIITSVAECHSTLESFYIKLLSSGSSAPVSDEGAGGFASSSLVLSSLLEIARGSKLARVTPVIEGSRALYAMPLSAEIGSISAACFEIGRYSGVVEPPSLMASIRMLLQAYKEVGAVDLEEGLLEYSKDQALTLAVHHMRTDSAFYKQHFIARRQAQLKVKCQMNFLIFIH